MKASESSSRLGSEAGWRRDECEEELKRSLENPLPLSSQLLIPGHTHGDLRRHRDPALKVRPPTYPHPGVCVTWICDPGAYQILDFGQGVRGDMFSENLPPMCQGLVFCTLLFLIVFNPHNNSVR